jgi:hypothetical protein
MSKWLVSSNCAESGFSSLGHKAPGYGEFYTGGCGDLAPRSVKVAWS